MKTLNQLTKKQQAELEWNIDIESDCFEKQYFSPKGSRSKVKGVG